MEIKTEEDDMNILSLNTGTKNGMSMDERTLISRIKDAITTGNYAEMFKLRSELKILIDKIETPGFFRIKDRH